MLKIRNFHLLSISFLAIFLCIETSAACTDFRIIALDKTVVIGRSMEFALDLKSNVRSSPRGTAFTTKAPDGAATMAWKSKYGYLYVDALDAPLAVDGMNEKGLSFEYLYLPGETKYPVIPPGKNAQALPYYRFGDWVLGNFATLDELRQALAAIVVFEGKVAEFRDTIFPVHASIFDASGKGLVIEFEDGKMNIYNNDVGVLTNSPSYDWHLVNLRNYLNLSPYNPVPVTANGMTFIATGQGAGMEGLPGDVSPPSRFVKVAMLLATALPVSTAGDAVNLAQHIINNVDIPKGFVRARQDNKPDIIDSTQWVVFKDLTHKMLYYRTYEDMTLKSLSLDKVNLAENAPSLKMPMVGKTFIMDVTQQFLKPTTPTTPTSPNSPITSTTITSPVPQ